VPRVWKSILRVAAGCGGTMALIMIACPLAIREPTAYSGEIAAIRTMRTVHTSQVKYFSQYARYASSLKELGDLIDPELASGAKRGYKFTMTGNASDYAIHADPENYGKTGSRTFYSDETMVIHQSRGPAPATATSPDLK